MYQELVGTQGAVVALTQSLGKVAALWRASVEQAFNAMMGNLLEEGGDAVGTGGPYGQVSVDKPVTASTGMIPKGLHLVDLTVFNWLGSGLSVGPQPASSASGSFRGGSGAGSASGMEEASSDEDGSRSSGGAQSSSLSAAVAMTGLSFRSGSLGFAAVSDSFAAGAASAPSAAAGAATAPSATASALGGSSLSLLGALPVGRGGGLLSTHGRPSCGVWRVLPHMVHTAHVSMQGRCSSGMAFIYSRPRYCIDGHDAVILMPLAQF